MQFGLYVYHIEDLDDDRTLRMVAVNPAAVALTGIAAEVLVGKTIDECFPGLREGGVPQQFAEVVRSGEPKRLLDFDYGDDRVPTRVWAFKVVPLPDSHVGVLFEDVSERERALMAAKLSELRFRALFERTTDGVFLYDLEGKTVAANQGAVRISGYSDDELIGRSFLDSAAPEQRELARETFQELLRGKAQGTYERTVRRKDGAEMVVEIDASLVCDRTGKPHHVQSICRDITKRRRTEDALKESEERFRTLVENAPEAIVVLDTDKGVFVHANENALELFKCRREDLYSLSPVDLSPERQHDGRLSEQAVATYLERAVKGETPAFEWTHRDFEGKETLCEVRLVRLSANHPNLIRGSMTDISERKRLERERVEFEIQLQQAQRLESLGVLAGGIAHDFNNLLVGVRGSATLALAELDSGQQVRKRLEQIDLAARRASELTNQLLVYSGKGRLEKELVDLNELIPEVEELLGTAVSKRMRLRFELASEPVFVLGDQSQIQQVAMNLIINASEAMTTRVGTVTVRTRVEEAETGDRATSGLRSSTAGKNRYHVLEVEDQGTGMDPSTQTRVLEPFFSTKFVGRGLGLATVSGIVRSHSGLLDIDSVLGRGTIVKVRFPSADKPEVTGGESPADQENWQGSGKILIVDDESAVRRLLAEQVGYLGFEVIEARDGREALTLYRQHWQELVVVLMDQTMPEMDGVESAKQMQLISADVPVVILSGYIREDVISGAAVGGVAGFIQKPYSFEDILTTLRDILD